jgi:hypothetical protein
LLVTLRALVGTGVLAAVVAADVLVELLDDPQPAASASKQHAASTAMPLFIGWRSFLDEFIDADNRTPV